MGEMVDDGAVLPGSKESGREGSDSFFEPALNSTIMTHLPHYWVVSVVLRARLPTPGALKLGRSNKCHWTEVVRYENAITENRDEWN
jgi:hypothetical protein